MNFSMLVIVCCFVVATISSPLSTTVSPSTEVAVTENTAQITPSTEKPLSRKSRGLSIGFGVAPVAVGGVAVAPIYAPPPPIAYAGYAYPAAAYSYGYSYPVYAGGFAHFGGGWGRGFGHFRGFRHHW